MCKIIVKFGEPITHEEMEAHRETNEDGAGFAGVDGTTTVSVTALKHEAAFRGYEKIKDKSKFWIFHSRMPSAGPVILKNAQPFASKSMLFCHNGTFLRKDLMLHLAMKGVALDGDESDSLLLFKFLIFCNNRTRKALLTEYDQNFVMADTSKGEVYIHGKFEFEQSKGKVLSARNKWAADKCVLVVGYDGSIRYKWVEKKKFNYTRYPSDYGDYSGYGEDWWQKNRTGRELSCSGTKQTATIEDKTEQEEDKVANDIEENCTYFINKWGTILKIRQGDFFDPATGEITRREDIKE